MRKRHFVDFLSMEKALSADDCANRISLKVSLRSLTYFAL